MKHYVTRQANCFIEHKDQICTLHWVEYKINGKTKNFISTSRIVRMLLPGSKAGYGGGIHGEDVALERLDQWLASHHATRCSELLETTESFEITRF